MPPSPSDPEASGPSLSSLKPLPSSWTNDVDTDASLDLQVGG